jgi:hypothetical protein
MVFSLLVFLTIQSSSILCMCNCKWNIIYNYGAFKSYS